MTEAEFKRIHRPTPRFTRHVFRDPRTGEWIAIIRRENESTGDAIVRVRGAHGLPPEEAPS